MLKEDRDSRKQHRKEPGGWIITGNTINIGLILNQYKIEIPDFL